VPVTIEVRAPGSLNAVETHVVSLDSEGRYSFQTLLQGSYDLSAKASHWLRQTVSGVSLQPGATVNFSLTNGDIDGDNEVSLLDFGVLVLAFGSVPGNTNWSPNADLDGDAEVSLLDLGILVRYFGSVGDE
ncbi:MAG: dockerin type I domain-containing protein, partial [Armatimonadetes bacterium]|nr:dockerin type I domain-containing protein [Armatimonadota bacterium]